MSQLGVKEGAILLRILQYTAQIQQTLSIIQTEMDKLFTRLAINHSPVWPKNWSDSFEQQINCAIFVCKPH